MVPKKKIAVVIPKYGLLGGAENHTAELTNRIAQRSLYDVHVLANKWTNHIGNITFHKIPIFTFPKFLTTIGRKADMAFRFSFETRQSTSDSRGACAAAKSFPQSASTI